MNDDVRQGQSYPLGATIHPEGVNFSVYSKSCDAIELLLFDAVDDPCATRVIRLAADSEHRTFHYWHAFVPKIASGQIYAYRVFGPYVPQRGLRYDSAKVLIDPYGRCVAVPASYSRYSCGSDESTIASSMKSVVADMKAYDWEGDAPLHHPSSHTVIYELHVRGFTRHSNSGISAERRGTYAGLIEKIPYLRDLGITAVELMPVFQYDPQDAPSGLVNYWGYNPVSFFSPHNAYSSTAEPLAGLDEFRDMVKALHKAGIEVILDVVFNHTAEGNEWGPTFSFKGFENSAYYILDGDGEQYANYSGTGNTLNANHAVVRRLVLDSLRYWVDEMHVDGFRFDLASVLSRDTKGQPLSRPPILWDIETDPVLSGTKLIAEAWDAAGLYQVGSFFGDRWKEWNGHFRDDVRSFVKGDPGYAGILASRFLASPDIYGHREREVEQSVNFITCHDGFTLNDVVTYGEKNNYANKEYNRDGHDNNASWNCGYEGETDDSETERLRNRQIKNFLTINLLALGVPMLLMGDEMRRTQRGNNNAYCHDSDLTWLDWALVQKHGDIYRFVQQLIRFRMSRPTREPEDITLAQLLRRTPIQWHGVKLDKPDWTPESRTVAFSVMGRFAQFHIMLNAHSEDLKFELPAPPEPSDANWRCIIDTYENAPDDFPVTPRALPSGAGAYCVRARSIVLLVLDKSTK